MKNKIFGPVFSIITPFNKFERVDYKRLFKYYDFYHSRGCRIFYLMAYNSRLTLLNNKEVEDLNIKSATYLKRKYKNVIFIGAEKVENASNDTITHCNKLLKNNVDMVSVIFGEKFYNNDQVYSHFYKISKKTKAKLLLHVQPITNGLSNSPPVVNYDLNLLYKICKLNSFVAIKEDVKNHDFTIKVLNKIKNHCTVIRSGGGMEGFLKYHKHGCQAWLVGIECIDPKIAFDFYKAMINKDYSFCKSVIKNIERPFFKLVAKYGWHLTIKSCLKNVNLMESTERMPLKKLNSKAEQKIFKFMDRIRNYSEKKLKKDYFLKVR